MSRLTASYRPELDSKSILQKLQISYFSEYLLFKFIEVYEEIEISLEMKIFYSDGIQYCT